MIALLAYWRTRCDITLNNSCPASITVSGKVYDCTSLDTGGTLSISKAIGSGETAVIRIYRRAVSITIGGGSGHFSAQTIDAGSFTFDASAQGNTDSTTGVSQPWYLSTSGVTTISLGANTD